MSLVLTMTLRLPRRLTSIYRKLEFKATRRHHQLHVIRSRNVEFLLKHFSDAKLELWAACTIVVVYRTARKRNQSQIPRCPGTRARLTPSYSLLYRFQRVVLLSIDIPRQPVRCRKKMWSARPSDLV